MQLNVIRSAQSEKLCFKLTGNQCVVANTASIIILYQHFTESVHRVQTGDEVEI